MRVVTLFPIGAAFMVAACSHNPAASFSASSTPPSAAGSYQAGKLHLAAGSLGLAVQAFRAALAADRGNVAAMNALAAAYDRMGRYDLADLYYERALAAKPGDASVLNNAGISRLLQGKAEAAEDLLEQAMDQAPENERIALNLIAARRAAQQQQAAALPAQAKLEQDAPETPEAETQEAGQVLHRASTGAWSLTTRPVTLRPPTSLVSAAARKLAPQKAESPPMALVSETVFAPPSQPSELAFPAETPDAPKPPSCALRVENSAGLRGMAGRMADWLRSRNQAVGCLGNGAQFGQTQTILRFRPNAETQARQLAAMLPEGVRLEASPRLNDDVVLSLGTDLEAFLSPLDKKRS